MQRAKFGCKQASKQARNLLLLMDKVVCIEKKLILRTYPNKPKFNPIEWMDSLQQQQQH